jgi:alkanesulfonate monooxygenase SsuD/methylene tetrahydromethanopterin reductase-like flavin-dependent oxidoreductase (luciferase family)
VDLGIGLPPGIPDAGVLGWARAAEAHGFASLAVVDHGDGEPLVTLAAAAAVTGRVKLLAGVAVVPYRVNAVLLAKQAATVDHLSGGRLVLGVAAGGREDAYQGSGVAFDERGRRLGAMLEEVLAAWAGAAPGFAGAVGPRPPRGRPVVVVGGRGDGAFELAAARADGWIAGGGGPEAFALAAERARAAWSSRGREGAPWLLGLACYALGPGASGHAGRYLADHHALLGPHADEVPGVALTDPRGLREALDRFEQAGCDELVMFPCNPDPAQVAALAEAVR